jgi:hypothetical protein
VFSGHQHHQSDWVWLAPIVTLLAGAALGYGSGWLADRRRDNRRARGAARLLARDLYEASKAVLAARASNEWPPDPWYRLPTSNWESVAVDFSAAVSDGEAWNAVAFGFERLQLENSAFDRGEAKSDDGHLAVLSDHLATAREALTKVLPSAFSYPVVPTRPTSDAGD